MITLGQPWLIACVRPSTDMRACKFMESLGVPSYTPIVEVRPRTSRATARRIRKPMFPGYVFCNDADHRALALTSTCPDIHSLLIVAGRLATLRDDQILAIRLTEETQARQRPGSPEWMKRFKRGEVMMVRGGPFFGQLARIEGLDGSGRVAVLLDMLGRKTRTSMPPEHLIA